MKQHEMNAPKDLRGVAAEVSARIEAVMRMDLASALADCDPLLSEVLHYSLFNGGKRIRPLLTVLSSQCCGRNDEGLSLLAVAFEYLHVATLIHDDVIDNADRRRGRATVVARFGMPAAILTGDWMHARSMHLIGRQVGPEGLEIFSRATTSMVNGEFAQLRLISDIDTEEAGYFEVIRQKTGNLIASSCTLGALYAGADVIQREALATYGQKIGAAFQVVDDLLDFLGESQTTGKSVGNDFIEGKMTLPLLRALAQADHVDRQALNDLMRGDRTRPGAYERLTALIQKNNGFDSALQTARHLIEDALDALSVFSEVNTGKEQVALLHELGRYILARNR